MQYRKSTRQKLKSADVRIFRQLFNICDRLLSGTLMIQMPVNPVVVIIRETNGGSCYTRIMCSDKLVVREIVPSLYCIGSNMLNCAVVQMQQCT